MAMRRRDFISLIGGAAATWPLAARAQQQSNKIPLVGVLWHAGSAEEEDVYLSVLVKAFNDLGYVEGKNIRLDHRFPAENPDRFRILARELVDEKPDVIIDVLVRGAVELKKLTDTIPIVFVIVADPVGYGLVKSLARPESNATGLSLMTTDLSGKRLEILKEAVPNLSQVALLLDPTVVAKEKVISANEVAAQALGLSVRPVEIGSPEEIEPTFAKMVQDGINGIAIGPTGLLFNQRARLGAAALRYKLPAMSHVAEAVPYGLLFSYGQDFPDFFRRAVAYTDKILEGAKPADLPVEQPTNFKLVLNLKTASALGIGFPRSLILSADEMIGA
jgi:putative tryptophan/tyrosine transport system substrate-binding protein